MTEHHIKVWPEHYAALSHPDPAKRKRVELRREDDRKYEVGDVLVLEEWDPKREDYTGRAIARTITHITRGSEWLQEGVAALSIREHVANRRRSL